MLHIGTTLNAGENINFSLDEQGKMYINAKSGAGELPWCSGYFQNRTLAANTWGILTPVATEGDLTLVPANENKFLATEDGLYTLSTAGGNMMTFTTSLSYIWKNTFDDINEAVVGSSQGNANTSIPGLSTTLYLRAGDFLSYGILFDAYQSRCGTEGPIVFRFTFAKIR